MSNSTFRDQVASLFKARPRVWIDGNEISQYGGQYAWRTRISNCRKELGMTIVNRCERNPDGSKRSLYKYVPADAANLLEIREGHRDAV